MKLKFLHTILLAGILLCFTIPANAATVTFDLIYEFSGATAPSGSPPWGRAVFDDGGGQGSVTLTMTSFLNQGTTTGEYFKEWYFNVDPFYNAASDLAFLPTVGDLNSGALSFSDLAADGDGTFDFKFTWPNPSSDPDGGFFANGDIVIWTITGTNLEASSFDFLSDGGGNSPDGLPTAAHVGGLGPTNDDSGWITTPIPGGLWLFLSGLIALVFVRKRIKN